MISIKLSKRLNAIAKLVDNKSVLADIGCDHALLDIYLIQNNIISKAIACDIKEGALNQANKNISYYALSKNIQTRLGDGLNPIKKEDNINTIVLSGMGDQKIISILKENVNKLQSVKTIIVQSNKHVDNIRKSVSKLGYYIADEVLVKDNNIIYTIIKFKKGYKKYTKKEIIYGPVLLKNKSNIFYELINSLIDDKYHVLNQIPKNKIFKIIILKYQIHKLKKEIH